MYNTPMPKKPIKRRKRSVRRKKKPSFINQLMITVLILSAISLIYSNISEPQLDQGQITLSELAEGIKNGEVYEVIIKGNELDIILFNEEGTVPEDIKELPEELRKKSKKESGTALSETLSNYGVTSEQFGSVSIEVKNETGFFFYFINIAPFLIPVFFIIFLIWYLSKQMKGAGAQALTFGQSRAKFINPKDKNKVTFKDVAGVKEAKQELEEIVDFLRSPKKFIEIGAQIPKGVLLMGAPGTGKTLLARAVAGEAGVSFFSISGSEFIEMFVGVGASRVRDLFKLAKAAAPAIIFIDEIDAVGRTRGSGMGGGNDEREQTLNQILVEMDGFETNEKVIVMAATNRPDVLDPAILRPGRFDRRVKVELPDRDDREQILKVHAKNKPLAEDVDFRIIAQRTPGFSGADLYSLMNESAIMAAREKRKTIGQFDMIRSIEKVMLGPERKSHVLGPKEKELTAYHEVGHALVASLLPDADPVHKISIISRGNAGGYTLKLPDNERKMWTRKNFKDDIAMTLGGYVTEEMVFGDISTGPSNDLQVATQMARDMVTLYGMSPEFGPIALKGREGRVMFGQGVQDKEYSEDVNKRIDSEINRILAEGYETAKSILTKYRHVLDDISKELLERENLEREDYEVLLKKHGIKVKKQEILK